MKVTYRITKKRGNWRPVLTYRCDKEDWEIDLAIPGGKSGVQIETVNSGDKCFAGEHERKKEKEKVVYTLADLEYPRSDNSSTESSIRLPWRPGAKPDFPEIEEVFKLFMAEWESRVMAALDSGAVDHAGAVEHTSEFKKKIAPFVAARKMLNNQ